MGVLAHQGGWDEILLILGPMVVVVVLLRLAKHRVERNLAATQRSVDPERGLDPRPDGTTPPER